MKEASMNFLSRLTHRSPIFTWHSAKPIDPFDAKEHLWIDSFVVADSRQDPRISSVHGLAVLLRDLPQKSP
jgi:hypothetical protein